MTEKASAFLATLAWTASAVASGGEEAASPFAGDIGNVFWTLVIFILVVLILGKFAWGPILNVLQKREDFIHGSLEQARKDREAASAQLREYERNLATAKAEATGIVDQSRRAAEELKRSIHDDTKEEAAAMIQRAKQEIGLATDTAVKELYDLTGKLATDIASRIIRKELSAADHERLIADSIEELRSTAGRNAKG